MKKIVHTSLLFLIFHFSFFISACEKIVDIDPDPAKQQLVLNAVPMPGDHPFVYFAHTRFFLDPTNDQPLDAPSVTLYVNGTPYAPDSVAACKYFFPLTLQPGDSVAVQASAAGRQASARTYVPLEPTVSNIRLYDNSVAHTFRYYNADFDFQDHAGVGEYYNLRVMVRDSGIRYNEWRGKFDTVDTVHSTYFLMRHSPEITGDASYVIGAMGVLYTRNMFNDSEIDGRNYHVGLEIIHLTDTNEVVDSVHTFKHEYTVSLESITYARLRYLIDVARQGSSNNFFTEQGQVRGNVEGALGIFAGMTRQQFTFWPDTLPAPPVASVPSLPGEVDVREMGVKKSKKEKIFCQFGK